jgi:hypothetical protein
VTLVRLALVVAQLEPLVPQEIRDPQAHLVAQQGPLVPLAHLEARAQLGLKEVRAQLGLKELQVFLLPTW